MARASREIGATGVVSLVRKSLEPVVRLGKRTEYQVAFDAVCTPDVLGRFCRLSFTDAAGNTVEQREVWIEFTDCRVNYEDVICLPPEVVSFELTWVEVLVEPILGASNFG